MGVGMRGRGLLSLAVLAALTLSGCVVGGSPGPSAIPENPPSPQPTVDQPAAKPDRIVISAEHIRIVMDDGTVGDEFTFFDPVADVTAELTVLLGQEPAVTTYEQEFVADYEWDGLRLLTDGPGQAPADVAFGVFVTAAEINGLGIETADGVRVGHPMAPIEAAHPAESRRWMYEGEERLDTDVGSVSVAPGDERMFSVKITAHPSDGPVTEFVAPMKNFE